MEASQQLKIKRNFVRYISHEMRTPLNTVILGLDYLHRELSSETSLTDKTESNKALLSIVRDLKQSSTNSVEVLNELLLYDKIEDNALTLELSNIAIKPFLDEIFSSFSIQVRVVCA